MFMGPRHWFQGMNSASICSLAGRYENPIPPRCLAPLDFLKIPALCGLCRADACFPVELCCSVEFVFWPMCDLCWPDARYLPTRSSGSVLLCFLRIFFPICGPELTWCVYLLARSCSSVLTWYVVFNNPSLCCVRFLTCSVQFWTYLLCCPVLDTRHSDSG